ncbi:Hypothetical predicted protein [Pelobates cultripes]|uniref:Reverse transcriptase domain-containing protein n=1 Tax=Pelobates cultripes TaxID=61616 RepID=A0AAD1WRM9_PELCU|nr:Hypothetical predicted protein [Pelobates cultripes]
MDQIAILCIVVEQYLEWNSSLYINFIDYEKAFHSVDQEVLRKLLQHNGIPAKVLNLIKSSYEGMTSRVIHRGQLTNSFHVKTGVRQGCLLSPFLSLITINWIMKTSTSKHRNGIQWTMWSELDDLDFAEGPCTSLPQPAADEKTKILKTNFSNINPIIPNGSPLEEVQFFTYLGIIIEQQGGTDADVKARIGKARVAFIQLKNIWAYRELTLTIKIRLFNSNVKSVLLYRAETWRTTKNTNKRIQTFINSCFRRILHIRWPDTVSNTNLWERTCQLSAEAVIWKRRWGWIGHTLHKLPTSPGRLSGETPKERGREVVQETPGDATSRQISQGWATPGVN